MKKAVNLNKIPVDIVLAPEWWHKNTGITFDHDFFFHPLKRVESEQRMEKELYERWGKYGLGADKDTERPEIGAVHLAAGYMLSEMLGCEVNYSENHPPAVVAANRESLEINTDAAFKSKVYRDFGNLTETLKAKYGYLTGDVNWGGVLNIAMDLRGDQIMMDLMMSTDEVKKYFDSIAGVIEKFTDQVKSATGTTSVSVTRTVRHLPKPVFLHSECSHTMVSSEDYEQFIMPIDVKWSRENENFGIHYCGNDPHRYAESFAKLPKLDFLDLGWGGDVAQLRKSLPNTFFNIRLSPVELVNMSVEEIQNTITKLVNESANSALTGVCCINMDDQVTDDKIDAIFRTVDELNADTLDLRD
jgi:hypothetical protein